jgi:hypothetical protein
LDNLLYLAAPITFNDPFDVIQVETTLPFLEDKDTIKGLIILCIKSYVGKKEDELLLPYNMKKYFSDINNLEVELHTIFQYYTQNNPITTEENAKAILHKFAEMVDYEFKIAKWAYQNQHYGIISFCSELHNILMWSHYGRNHHGFAIGFDLDKLLKNLEGFEYGFVSYSKQYPYKNFFKTGTEDWLSQDALAEIYTKSDVWSYEREFRISKLFKENTPINSPDRIFKYDKNIISEVVFGCMEKLEEDDYRNEILDYCKLNKIPVYQMVKESYEFKLFKQKRKN